MEGEGEFEFNEEELVDFEGSDYSIEFDEEFGDEDVGAPLTSTKVENILYEQTEHIKQPERRTGYPFSGDQISTAVCSTTERSEIEAENATPNLLVIRHSCSQEGVESGEIEEDKDEKEDGAASQTASSFDATNLEDKGWQGRDRKHLRADLEDGELEDAAMPEPFDHEGEANTEACRISDKCIGQERKRRNFKFLSEWQRDEKEKESMEAQSTATLSMQNHLRGSSFGGKRLMGTVNVFSTKTYSCWPAGTRGSNMHVFGHPHGNLGPGVMAPTRPLMPRGLHGPVNQFGVPLGMLTPIQFQEALMQEQMMMSNHALHLGVNGRPSFNMDVPPYPFVGMDYFGARPRGMMHIQPHGPGMVPPINYLGSFENTSRIQRPIFGVGRNLGRGSYANMGGRGGSFARNGFGRPASWPSNPFDMPSAGRGRGRGQIDPLSLRHEQSLNAQRIQVRVEDMAGLGHEVLITDVNNADKMQQDARKTLNPIESDNNVNSKNSNTNNAQQQSNSENIDKSGPHSASNGTVKNRSISNITKSSIEDDGKTTVSSMLPAFTSNSREAGPGATNMIKLGTPVQRSRVLSVGGLPEGTPLSVVIEAFEKQGKIMQDVKKEEKEDLFTITFSTLLEAVSAKRLLHRSVVGGKQITVDYSV
ncbi:uncharacterized protein LOC131060522 isoform X1 [Cryptomeria japonica]|uniref:uncharacterized protein LOC131060522 isoform X1 n=1 Tax=Cryptomeria japonica TaxID=3369 RepID=UPI0025AC837C|nr:uncharacterized protein LOC131060522 isoform X1 [Cryptomeria japonica]XP_057849745.1 uncharacterized protein LOC131060522 isoform X1 [Cryptomeria japonica]XP_057849746.1 uncharacterized protein LOC131060522 isoform X1 [Cryptomeria japonica]XP_057849747.1 uncharacterized protein LOC131060522 isoform X1 [Cryptomeria japonica]XP_057849748.1 uncharacterized protein LOC131060522 isoform X1 [Cryptomeria japonica]XP_057849749.1 uncharacterized protein LOC131060522 isoform X1 [Cryptomeria japonica]